MKNSTALGLRLWAKFWDMVRRHQRETMKCLIEVLVILAVFGMTTSRHLS